MKQEKWPPDSAVEELLKLANTPADPIRKEMLRETLAHAKAEYDELSSSPPIPRKVLENVAKAARALNAAMNAANRYRPRADEREKKGLLRVIDWMENRGGAQAEVSRILAAAEKDARTTRRRGQPMKVASQIVVQIAVQVLEQRLKTFVTLSSARHVEFIELFYETVTGEKGVQGKLDWLIRRGTERILVPENWLKFIRGETDSL